MKILMEKFNDKYIVFDSQTWHSALYTEDELLASEEPIAGVEPTGEFVYYETFENYQECLGTTLQLFDTDIYKPHRSKTSFECCEILNDGGAEKIVKYVQVSSAHAVRTVTHIPQVDMQEGVFRLGDYVNIVSSSFGYEQKQLLSLRELDLRGVAFFTFCSADVLDSEETLYENLEILYLPLLSFDIDKCEFAGSKLRHVYSGYFAETPKLSFCNKSLSATISRKAFQGSENLLTVDLRGYSIETITEDAFKDCTALQTVYLPELIQKLEYGAFSGCTSLQECELPESLQTIQESAFEKTGLKRVVLPDGIVRVEDCAFRYCGALEYVEIADADGLKDDVFQDCKNLRCVVVHKSNYKVSDSFVKRIFRGSPNIETFVFGDGVWHIELSALLWFRNLKEVVLKHHGKYAVEISVDILEGLENVTFTVYKGSSTAQKVKEILADNPGLFKLNEVDYAGVPACDVVITETGTQETLTLTVEVDSPQAKKLHKLFDSFPELFRKVYKG